MLEKRVFCCLIQNSTTYLQKHSTESEECLCNLLRNCKLTLSINQDGWCRRWGGQFLFEVAFTISFLSFNVFKKMINPDWNPYLEEENCKIFGTNSSRLWPRCDHFIGFFKVLVYLANLRRSKMCTRDSRV